ncbi:UPF0461 protein C5orf24 homolog [Carassius auratus]|uniref:UPF0461 protein C5orf24 homolog n=1 Tax=Carassius auratus TaxID=7957 RepID=A0A6P6LZL9_CARAU|nr:UPF0461 protein C5orf24 homolog [Carassius auratus]XP_026089904.1 UPF0461 protein C5orf24 homolog [Carassius auratus]XP_052392312.1 UPF0461 protein C5orf24 homolog [Carassius gibelio]XP_052392313.1 UPF0461 protein C5orf24 homolog [Carassius gibelio]XP_052392314.1 UPF0461 protein C5orf24 homolog [Carassius gibelio]
MMRQVSSSDYCVDSRPSCLAEDGRLSPSHFDLCPTKFYPSAPPQRSRQMCFTYLPSPAAAVLKPTPCQRQDRREEPPMSLGPAATQANEKSRGSKKKGASGKSGKRGRPPGTTKSAGYRTSTGRPPGTTRAAGFKTSPGRPLGTTRAAGYKVSPGRPPGSIKSQSRPSKLSYSACSGAAFPYSIIHKPGAGDAALKEETTTETQKMLLQAPQFLLSTFPIRNQKTPPQVSTTPSEPFPPAAVCPDGGQSRNTLPVPIHSALPTYS